MFDQIFLIIVLLYGVAAYFHGHQGSHLAYIKIGEAVLNPFITLVLWIYHITFLPWLTMIWLGYKTVWYYPIIVILAAQAVRFALVLIQDNLGLTSKAAYISLLGIVAIPTALAGIIIIAPEIADITLSFS